MGLDKGTTGVPQGDAAHGCGQVVARQGQIVQVGSLYRQVSLTAQITGTMVISNNQDNVGKPGTIRHLRQTENDLVEFFGTEKHLRDITPGDADEFRLHLMGRRLGENTIRRRCGRAKQFFRAALRRGLIANNPFADIATTVQANPSRYYFITREEALKVLDACPDAEWRLIFALARFGGLRTPSETLLLRWRDIDWDRGRFRVRSPKTEHIAGGAERIVPIFPELRPYLNAAWDEAETGAEFVIGRCRDSNINLRSRLLDIIWAAGLKEWPKLFQNLRSTRETELAEEFPLHVVCQWIGNSQPIAAKHYLQTTDEHFAKALKADSKAGQKPGQSGQVLSGHGGTDRRRHEKTPERTGSFRGVPDCTSVQVTPTGLEPVLPA